MTKRVNLTVLVALLLLLSACNFPLFGESAAEEVQDDTDLLATSVAGTIQAMSVQSQPDPTQPPAEQPTAQAIPTLLPTTAVVSPPVATAQPCNLAEFYSETVEDGTQFNLGESFTKTWTFTNTGTCTWNTDYKLVFVSGDLMGGSEAVNLPNSVAPQTTVAVSVDLVAPKIEGTYTGYWALQDDQKILFFTNNSVKIVASRDAFMVKSVTTNLIDRSPSDCTPYKYYYSMDVTTTSAGNVKYYTTDSESTPATTSPKTLTFDAAGTQNVDMYMEITVTDSYWVKVYIDVPNHQWFGPFKFDITCP